MLPKRLPAEPFARWLDEYSRVSGMGNAELAACLGLVARRIQSYRYRHQALVAFDVVDRALLNAPRTIVVDDRPVFVVDDLYPWLEDLEAA